MAIICNPQRFYLAFRNYYNTKDLLYINSLGAIETIRLRGEIDSAADYTQTQAQKIDTPEYFKNGVLDGQSENIYNPEQESFTADTGFITQENLERLRDLFTANKEKKLYEIKNGRLLPVNIISKNVTWYTNNQKLFSASIQWQYAFSNQYFTPDGTINPMSGTCPACESFNAIQSGRDKITVTWALQTGYIKIKIEIIVSGSSTFFYLDGTTGQAELPFTNPNIPVGANIYIKGSTVCNDQVTPYDVGNEWTINLRVFPNHAPTAVNDTFNITAGYTTPQTFDVSVLDNDFDIDGDEFKATPASGATTAGGTYSIDEDGYVTYTPPTAEYTGIDSFIYTITETGTGGLSATGTVYINVTAVIQPITVYVKLDYRSRSVSLQGLKSTWYEQVYLEFFSDAAGSIPMDVTGIGLNIFVRKIYADSNNTLTNYDLSFAAVSYELKIFDGTYLVINPRHQSDNFSWSWAILSGAGYKAI
ncbi:MAG TPA: Ig-like domain-containing protein [Chitinophagaceae bacterium]|nr:Ig-like domain-containing protein [Chitinophagaceae bacterium]